VIEPTDEMVNLAADMLPGLNVRVAGDLRSAMRDVLAAVFVLVEREQPGLCQAYQRSLIAGPIWPCILRHGHLGDHTDGTARWRECSR
jgi:hypothetical protein